MSLRPPKIAAAIIEKMLEKSARYQLMGDFYERYSENLAHYGKHKANVLFYLFIAELLPQYLTNIIYRSSGMLKSYLKIAFRNFSRRKTYSFINITGLSIGMVSFILIMLYVRFELSYDSYHTDYENIYRVVIDRKFPSSEFKYAVVSPAIVRAMTEEIPEVTGGTRINNQLGNLQVKYMDKYFTEKKILFADSSFFDIFSIKLLKGDPETALIKPYSVVITSSLAIKYFGDSDPVGEVLQLGSSDFQITGVSENVPQNTHFTYDLLGSFSTSRLSKSNYWSSYNTYNYVRLREDADTEDVLSKLTAIEEKYARPQIEQSTQGTYEEYKALGNRSIYHLQNISDIHLKSNFGYELETNGNHIYVYIFFTVGILILLVACINFANLSTAHSSLRAREIGIRKVLGTGRKRLILQFMIESVLTSTVSLIAALFLVKLALPFFNSLAGKDLSISYFADPVTMLSLLSLAGVVGILAGIYPALFLTRYSPSKVLKGNLSLGVKNPLIRNNLLIVQFTFSIGLIISTIIIQKQLNFMINANLGFDKEHVILVEGTNFLRTQSGAFKEELTKDTKISSVAFSTSAPGKFIGSQSFLLPGEATGAMHIVSPMTIDEQFLSTYNIKLKYGKNFSGISSQDSMKIIVNESAAKQFGFDEDPTGKIILSTYRQRPYEIIGVVHDFNYRSLHSEISPVVIFPASVIRFTPGIGSIKISGAEIPSTIALIQEKWEGFTGGMPFIYSFLDEGFAQLYTAEEKTKKVLTAFSLIAVVIASLGLYGLSAYIAQQRRKEMSIRKVLGASTYTVWSLFTKEFTKIILISFGVTLPLTYYLLTNWLQNFAYRTDLPIAVYLMSGMLVFLTALATVSYHSLKLARSNPVHAINYE